jgi:UPF0042 nucleotide-binding protein
MHIQTDLTSFGYGHRQPPAATIVVDTRELLLDPHIEPDLRVLTGTNSRVRERVMATPGAVRLVANLADTVIALLQDAGDPNFVRVDVAIGCVGGRHRSVVLVDALAYLLEQRGVGVQVTHLDVERPVLTAR